MARIHFETDCVTEIKISLNSITYELDFPVLFTDTSSHHEKTVTEILISKSCQITGKSAIISEIHWDVKLIMQNHKETVLIKC